jgi:hypothetical protein
MSRVQIAPTAENMKAIRERYYGKPALFLTEILGMDLDDWQRELCDEFHEYDRFAVSSGHSSGKTAYTAGIIIYFITVHPDPQIVVTANTENQLRQKTWRELAKWHNQSLIKDWFKWTATTFSLKGSEETWFAAAVPNTANSSESFAGVHEKYILQIFDEASAIERVICEVAEGATATEGGYRKWLMFGNPTRSDGAFFDCFHKMSHRWRTKFLDTRTCKYADQTQIKEWEEDYGEDSDFFRVRVKGQFPRVSSMQFIGQDAVEEAFVRTVSPDVSRLYPLVFGVDVARYGDDASVIVKRRGHKLMGEPLVWRGIDTVELRTKITDEYRKDKPDLIYIDADGLGAAIYDELKKDKLPVVEVRSGITSSQPKMYSNCRAEMWGEMKDWLKLADMPRFNKLREDLTGIQYGYDAGNRIQLESKKAMKGRGLESPDCADPLAYTFYPFAARTSKPNRQSAPRANAGGWT